MLFLGHHLSSLLPPPTPISYRKIPLFSLLSFPLKLWHSFTGMCADFMGPFPVWYMALQPISHQGSEKELLACLSTVFHCLFLSSCLADDQDEGKRLSCHLQLPMSMLRFSSFSFNTHRYGKRLCSKQCHADGLVSLPLHFLFQMQQSHSQRSSILFCFYAVLRWKRLCEVGKRKRP